MGEFAMVSEVYSEMRLIVSDLDGTLVRYASEEVPQFTRDVIATVTKAGGCFTIATGRSWEGTRRIAAQLGITFPLILQSGALIVEPPNSFKSDSYTLNSDMKHSTGDSDTCPRSLRMIPLRPALDRQLRNLKSATLNHFYLDRSECYCATRIVTTEGEALLKNLHGICVMNSAAVGGTSSYDDVPDGPVLKHLFTGAEQPLKQLRMALEQELDPCPNLVLWPPDPQGTEWLLEVFDPRASKGQALQWLASYLKIPNSKVIAFGNDWNDLDLLQHAGMGVAVDNAPAEVLAAARFEIPGPEKEGVAYFLMDGKGRERHVK